MDGILGEGKGAGQSAARDEMRRGEERCSGVARRWDEMRRPPPRRHGQGRRTAGAPGLGLVCVRWGGGWGARVIG